MPKEFYVVLMVLSVFVPISLAVAWDAWLKHKRKLVEIQGGDKVKQLSEEKAELNETVEMLQDRLNVVERIVTDPARQTADEIEKLR